MSIEHKLEITTPGGTEVGTFGGYAVVLVRRGDRYGLRNSKVYEKATKFSWDSEYREGDPLVEFYDVRCANKPGFHTVGQYVSRYYLSTLRNHLGSLCFDASTPTFRIEADAFRAAMEAVERLLHPIDADKLTADIRSLRLQIEEWDRIDDPRDPPLDVGESEQVDTEIGRFVIAALRHLERSTIGRGTRLAYTRAIRTIEEDFFHPHGR